MPSHPRLLALLLAPSLILTLLPAFPTHAWDDTGHRVAAAIAWNHLSPATRHTAADLLLQAPPSSRIATLAPRTDPRRLFLEAATWPDLVKRDATLRGRYNHPGWHYVNLYWRTTPGGTPEPVPHLSAAPENAAERLHTLSRRLADRAEPAAERALALAWVLHLVADLHQPLHASSRVTDHPDERHGDKGGNTFRLHRDTRRDGHRRWNLHSWWDTLLDRSRPRRFWESRRGWEDRLARQIAAAVAEPVNGPVDDGVEAWARESLRLAQSRVYDGVERGEEPPADYARAAAAVADRRLATAGRRLAALLERLLPPAQDGEDVE